MIDDYYGFAWACYLAASLGLLIVFWLMTRSLWSNVANVLRIILAAILLTPWTASMDESNSYLAPALMVSLFEGLNDGLDYALRGAYPIVAVTLLALVVFMIYVVAKMMWGQRSREPKQQPRRQPSF